jgi:hypothetical protein
MQSCLERARVKRHAMPPSTYHILDGLESHQTENMSEEIYKMQIFQLLGIFFRYVPGNCNVVCSLI